MALIKKLLLMTVALLILFGVYGCKKEGPAERAGKKIDQALQKAKDKLDDTSK